MTRYETSASGKAIPDADATSPVFDWAKPEEWHPILAAARERPGARVGTREMRALFPAVRAYHAARPLSPATYLAQGIRPLTAESWQNLVAECFLANEPPPVTAAIRAAASRQFALVGEGMGPRTGRVHFCADARLLTERDGYHLLYGSLSLLAVAIQVDNALGTDLKSTLRQRGVPTVFVCNVATALMTDGDLAQLASHLMRALDHGTAIGPETLLGCHFSIQGKLPPTAILAKFHPERVVDWVYGRHIGAV